MNRSVFVCVMDSITVIVIIIMCISTENHDMDDVSEAGISAQAGTRRATFNSSTNVII